MKHAPSENMRTEYRRALMRGGVPEVYAHMAAQEMTTDESCSSLRAMRPSSLLWGGFVWQETLLGYEFWSAIADEASA